MQVAQAGNAAANPEPNLLHNDAEVGEGPVRERTDRWKIWYRSHHESTEWFLGMAENCMTPGKSSATFVRSVRWVKGSFAISSVPCYCTCQDYEANQLGHMILETDPNEESGYESPRRKVMRGKAASDMRKLGARRVLTKYQKVKNQLEVGDVVNMPVTWRQNNTAGDTSLVAVVALVLPRQRYKVITLAGHIDSVKARNELQLQQNIPKEHVGIPLAMYSLPPISEHDALKLMNPMVNSGVYCRCRKVR